MQQAIDAIVLEPWAEIVVKIWQERIIKLGIVNTRELLNSFIHTVNTHSGGDSYRIQFMYTWYGKMLDMGVGRGTMQFEVGTTKRQPAPWLSKTFIVELRKLIEFTSEHYAGQAAFIVSESINKP